MLWVKHSQALHQKKMKRNIYESMPLAALIKMALSRGTLEGQKSDEDFKGEVSAKKVLSSNNCLDKKEICLRNLYILFIFIWTWRKEMEDAGYTKVWFWAHLKYTVFHF